MPFAPLASLCPAVAGAETRLVTVPPGAASRLPADDYRLEELYCDEDGCDCRRVMFFVSSRQRRRVEAVVAYGWEDLAFYRKWLRHGRAADAVDLRGPSLNAGSPGSELATAVLDMVRNLLRTEPEFVAQVKRHYRLFRAALDRGLAAAVVPTDEDDDEGDEDDLLSAAAANDLLRAAGLKLGDSVRVKPGVLDPDFQTPIGGWQGRLAGVFADGSLVVLWDSHTVRAMGFETLVRAASEDLDWQEMVLEPPDVERSDARDTATDVLAAVAARERELAANPRVPAAGRAADNRETNAAALVPPGPGSSHLERYQYYRARRDEAATAVRRHLETPAVLAAAIAHLGLEGPWEALDDAAQYVVDDLLLYEPAAGQNAVQRCFEEDGGRDAGERDMLAAIAAAQLGLYQIEAVWPNEGAVELRDLTGSDTQVRLTDVALSRSRATRVVVCARLFTVGGLTMTTGTAMFFPGELKRMLARQWRRCAADDRFRQFVRLYRHHGLPVSFR